MLTPCVSETPIINSSCERRPQNQKNMENNTSDVNQLETYNKTNFIQNDLNSSILERFSEMFTWKSNEVVLDIGFGDAKFTVEGLLPKLPKDLNTLIGCEYIRSKVEYAASKYTNAHVQFIELDIQTKKLGKDFYEKFDHVFSFHVFHWVQDLRQAFENIYSMMKPGSEFFIVMPEEGADEVFHNLSKKIKWASYGHEKYISKFLHIRDRTGVFETLLGDIGFVKLKCLREKTTYKHKSKEVCEEMFKSINPIVPEIPKDELEDYYRDYVKELKKHHLCRVDICAETQEEICTSNYMTLIIYGQKPYIQ